MMNQPVSALAVAPLARLAFMARIPKMERSFASSGSGRQRWAMMDPIGADSRASHGAGDEDVAVNKAFTRESDEGGDEDDDVGPPPLPQGTRNYVTPGGYARLRAELMNLLDDERPKIVEVVSWAAKNGDRSENGDYLYGKKRLREIDRRIRFLTKRLDIAEVVDPSVHHGHDQVFFGATVTYANERGEERTITIKGIDEADSSKGEVSWIAPVSRALLKAKVGDEVSVVTPGGLETIEVVDVTYPLP
jgi:transcription elongation factor GreB